MTTLLNILIVIFFVFLNAFFVIAEFSMVKLRKSQVNVLLTTQKASARYVKLITDNLNAYLSACQLGITLASLALGWIGEPTVSKMIGPLLHSFGLNEAAIHSISVILGFAVITTLHIVLGELIPKSLAILSTEKSALFSAMPLVWFYRLTYPIIWLFNTITNVLLKLMGHDNTEEHSACSDEELKILIAESCRFGLIPQEKYEYMDNIFDLEESNAQSIMTPRRDMACLYTEDSLATHLATASESKFTRYPVCSRDKDHLIGFVHIKDLYHLSAAQPLQSIVREMAFVHESTSISRLLQLFKKENTKMVAVIDEHGGVSGIATLSDAIAEIVGEIEDEYTHGEVQHWKKLGENHYQTTGSTPIEMLTEQLVSTSFDISECETIGGFLLEQSGELPEQGQEIHYDNLRFIIKSLDDKKIGLVDVIISVPNETNLPL